MKRALQIVLAIAVLAFAGTATAVTVILDGDNVIRIENLEVQLDQGTVLYNVDFITSSGDNLYGSDPASFDFPLAEDAATAIIQVNNALNLNDPIPNGAGPLGTDQYFIPGLERTRLGITAWGAFGGENLGLGGLNAWDACEVDCLGSGIAILFPDEVVTYAKFTVVPVPAAVWLFGSALGLLGWVRRRTT